METEGKKPFTRVFVFGIPVVTSVACDSSRSDPDGPGAIQTRRTIAHRVRFSKDFHQVAAEEELRDSSLWSMEVKPTPGIDSQEVVASCKTRLNDQWQLRDIYLRSSSHIEYFALVDAAVFDGTAMVFVYDTEKHCITKVFAVRR